MRFVVDGNRGYVPTLVPSVAMTTKTETDSAYIKSKIFVHE